MHSSENEKARYQRMIVPIVKMKRGERGIIVQINGGFGFQSNIKARGVRKGKTLIVKEIQPWGGPVLIDVDGEEMALGRGMAQKILIEVEKKE